MKMIKMKELKNKGYLKNFIRLNDGLSVLFVSTFFVSIVALGGILDTYGLTFGESAKAFFSFQALWCLLVTMGMLFVNAGYILYRLLNLLYGELFKDHKIDRQATKFKGIMGTYYNFNHPDKFELLKARLNHVIDVEVDGMRLSPMIIREDGDEFLKIDVHLGINSPKAFTLYGEIANPLMNEIFKFTEVEIYSLLPLKYQDKALEQAAVDPMLILKG